MNQVQAVQEKVGRDSQTRRWTVGVALVVLAGCVARFWHLGEQSLWFDEGYTAWVVTLSPSRIIEVIRNDASPPLYYLMLKPWAGLFGHGEAALRSLSAVASCLTIIVTGAIAWRMTRSRAAVLVAASLMSASVLQIQYAQEARSYGLASLFAAIGLYAAVRRMTGGPGWLILLTAMLASCAYLHNMMWFYVAGFGLAYLVMPGSPRFWRRVGEYAAVCVVVVLIYAWWIPALLGQIRWLHGNFWAQVPGAKDLGQVLVAASGMKLMHLTVIASGTVIGWATALLIAGLCITALAGRSRETVRWAIALLLVGLLPVLAVYGYAQVSQSYFVEKVFTASSLTVPLLGALVVSFRSRWVGALLIPALLIGSAVSVWGYFQREQKEDWRGAMTYVNSLPREGTLVVFVANEGELLYEYYLRQQGGFSHALAAAPQRFHELQPPRTIQRVLSESDTAKLKERLHDQHPQRVVLVSSHTHFSDPQGLTRKAIEDEMQFVQETNFNLVDVVEFRR